MITRWMVNLAKHAFIYPLTTIPKTNDNQPDFLGISPHIKGFSITQHPEPVASAQEDGEGDYAKQRIAIKAAGL